MISAIRNKVMEIRQFRYMYRSLVTKNLFGKYRNSVLGFLWNFVTPAISVFLFYIVFENFMGSGVPYYWAYLCIGMVPFTFMNTNLIGGATNIISNGEMVKKIYFPREILPLAQVTYTFIVFVIALVLVALLMIATGFQFTVEGLLALPIVVATMFLFSLGSILLTSSISVYVRDFAHLISAFSRLLFWVTPIFYMADSLSGILSIVIWLNPYTFFVEGFHNAMYEGVIISEGLLLGCIIISLVTFIAGLFTFVKLKDGFAERI